MSDTCEHGSYNPTCQHTKPTKFELKVAKALCDAQGEYAWKWLKGESCEYAYYDYIEMAMKVIKTLRLKDESKRSGKRPGVPAKVAG